MSAPNDNHEPTTLDGFCDRLADRGLAEIVGQEIPPDLRERILAAHVAVSAAVGAASRAAQPVASNSRRSRAFWGGLAVAVMLLVGTSLMLLPSVQLGRKVARSTVVTDSSRNQGVYEEGVVLPSEASSPLADGQIPTTPIPSQTSDFDIPFRHNSFASGQSGPKFGFEPAPGIVVERYLVEYEKPRITLGFQGLVNDADQKPADSSVPAAAAGKLATMLTDGPVDTGGPVERHFYFSQNPEQIFRNHLSLENKAGVSLDVYGGYGPGRGSYGPGSGSRGDQYTRIVENRIVKAEGGAAVSTFSIDVDTAAYTNVRQFLMQMNTLPPPDAVRIEELINYFDYNYAPPISPADPVAYNTVMATARAEAALNGYPPFAAHVEVAGCPWAPEHRLVRIGIKGREMDRAKRPKSNLVFLVDVSGSMDDPAKLPLVVYGLEQLTRELGENDRVAIVVYASSEGLVLPSTHGDQQDVILAALGRLQAGGSTAGGAGIQLAYQLAEDNFIEGGTNRVILCTDGDFNVGVTSTAELQRMVEQKAKDTRVFLSVLGFGRGNLNDAMMEAISNHGNGNYHYVDNRSEARRVLVKEMAGTLVTIAKDVKIQVEFNPRQVAGYRLIGYENRMLRTEDFNDDKKDAGEIGAGHTVTALYEIVPAGKPVAVGAVDDLKYQQPVGRTILSVENGSSQPPEDQTDKIVHPTDIAGELLTLKMRYKQPDSDTSRKLEWPVADAGQAFAAATGDFQFAAAVAGFGLLLRDSQYKGDLTYAAVLELAQPGVGSDEQGQRAEFLEMVRRAKTLRGE